MGVKHAIVRAYLAADNTIRRGLKQFVSFVQTSYWWGADGRSTGVPGSRINYANRVGDGTGSSTVTAPLFWVARTFPEAPPALWGKMSTGEEEQILDHPMLRLLERPNQFFTGVTLWMATVIDYQVDGNAYWRKVRRATRRPGELWWIPHWLISPKAADGVFIDRYEINNGGRTETVPVEDIVHFRFGMDPDNPRLGRSPLKSVLREVLTDDEAAQFTASLLTNMGVPGLMISPERGLNITEEQALAAKGEITGRFTGDRRGEPIVMTGATKVEQFGFSPEQLMLRELRRIPEERVTAVMGIPAIVAGLGAGLDRSTFTNMGEAREAAYEAGIIPMQRIMAEDVRFQLLSDFEPDPFSRRFGFDLSKVRVLQEDLSRQAQRHDVMIRGGWETVAEGRRAMGLPVEDDRDNVFLRPLNVQATDGLASSAPTEPPAARNGSGNGDTQALARELARELELTRA